MERAKALMRETGAMLFEGFVNVTQSDRNANEVTTKAGVIATTG